VNTSATKGWLVAIVVTVMTLVGVAWLMADTAPVTTDRIGDKNQTLPRGQLPVFAETDDVKALYKFAVENPDTLRYMPCVCGCGGPNIGHTSNRACYIKDEPPGRVTFTSHAAT
jgi:hypothetical protein